MADLEDTIKLTADASGVEAGVGKAKRSLADLGASASQVGKQGGDGLSAIGAGGEAASRKVDAATKNMIGSIQRTTAALEAGAKSGAKYYEALAQQRGINVESLRPYLSQLEAARAAQDKAKESVVSLGKGFELAKASVVAFGAAVGASLAAAVSFSALKAIVLDSTEAAAKLHDLSIQTGATVEALSALASIGKLSDIGVDQIAGSMNKLAKNLSGVSDESKGAGQALAAIGLDFASFTRLKPEEQFQAIASAMGTFEDGAGKAAVSMTLFGKEGAKLLPLFKDLATSGDLVAKVTTQQAAMADDFADNLTRLKVSGEAWKKELAFGMLPALNMGLQAFIDISNAAGGLRGEITKLARDGTITEWTKSGIVGLSYLIDGFIGVKRVIASVAEFIGVSFASSVQFFESVGTAAQAIAKLNFGKAVDAVRSGVEKQKEIFSSFRSSLDATFGEQTFGQKLRARIGELDKLGGVAEDVKKKLDFTAPGKEDKGAQKAIDDLRRLVDQLNAKDLGVEPDFLKNLTALANLGPRIGLTADQIKRLQEALIEQQPYMQKQAKLALELAQAHDKYIVGLADAAQKIELDVEKEREHAAQIGLSKAAIAELGAAKYDLLAVEAELRATRQYDKNLDEVEYNNLKRIAQGYRDLASAKRGTSAGEAALEQLKEIEAEGKRFYQSIYDGLTDSLMRGFEAGKGFFRSFWDGIKNTLKTTVLKVAVQGVLGMTPLASLAGQSSAFGNVGGAFGSASGLFGPTGALSSFGTFGSAASSVAAGVYGGVGELSSLGFGEALTGGLSAVMEGSIAAGFGTLAGVLGPIGLAAAAAMAIFGGQGGGPKNIGTYSTNNSLYDATRTDTTAASNTAAQTVAQGIIDSYTQAVASLGIKGGKLDTAVLTSVDDKGAGDAMTGLVLQGFLNGRLVFDRNNAASGSDDYKNVGRSPEELAAALAEGQADVLLAALKASDLSPKLAEYFSKLDPLQLNAAQIQASLTAAQNAQSLFNVLGNLGPAFKSVADLSVEALNTLASTYSTDPNKFAADLQSFYANFTPAGEQRSNAVNSVVAGLGAAGINVSFDQVANATAEQVSGLMGQLIAMGDAGKEGAFALLSLNGVIKQIIDTAARPPTQQELNAGVLNLRTPGLVTEGERKNILAGQISEALSKAGIDVSTEQLLGASTAQVREFYQSLVAVGNTTAAKVVVDFADSLLSLTQTAQTASGEVRGYASNYASALERQNANIAAYESFQKQAAGLLVGNLQNAIDAVQQRLSAAKSTLVDAYNREASSLRSVIDAENSRADSLKQARIALNTGSQSGLTGSERYQAAKRALTGATADNASGLVSTYLDAAKSKARSSIEYLREVAAGRAVLTAQEAAARERAHQADLQLTAMTSLVGSMVDLNGGVKSLTEAILGVKSAQGSLDFANLNQSTYGMSQSAAGDVFEAYIRAQIEASGGSYADFQHQQEFGGVNLDEYLRKLPSYDVGTYRVPQTGPAILHEGEAVIPAGMLTKRSDGGESDAVVAAIAKLEARLAAIETTSKKTADTLTRVTRDGTALVTQ